MGPPKSGGSFTSGHRYFARFACSGSRRLPRRQILSGAWGHPNRVPLSHPVTGTSPASRAQGRGGCRDAKSCRAHLESLARVTPLPFSARVLRRLGFLLIAAPPYIAALGGGQSHTGESTDDQGTQVR